ncbi:MAG: hypothetical protein R3F38_01315 [Gammaproteobacteria bacterium]
MSLSIKAGAGFITRTPAASASWVHWCDQSGRWRRLCTGGQPHPARRARRADNAIPGAKLRAATGPVTPVPDVIDFDKARAQLATFQQANTFVLPLVEECPECLLAATQAVEDPAATDDFPGHTPIGIATTIPTNASIPWETSIWMDTPFYEKALLQPAICSINSTTN